MKRKFFFLVLIFISTFVWSGMVSSVEALSLPSIQLGVDDVEEPEKVSSALQILFLLTILTLAPSILILTTSFARIVIVLSFLRQAMGTQQTPPTQILIGLGLFLTLFVMGPTWTEINNKYRDELEDDWAVFDRAQKRLD